MMMYQTIRFVMPLCMTVSILSGCGKSEEATTPSSPKPTAVSASPKVTTTPIAVVPSPPSSPSSATALKPQTEKTPKPAEVKCPATEIKGNIGKSGKIYHTPGSNGYEGVKAEVCFKDVASAEKAGYRAPK
jgi:hypothetical protein